MADWAEAAVPAAVAVGAVPVAVEALAVVGVLAIIERVAAIIPARQAELRDPRAIREMAEIRDIPAEVAPRDRRPRPLLGRLPAPVEVLAVEVVTAAIHPIPVAAVALEEAWVRREGLVRRARPAARAVQARQVMLVEMDKIRCPRPLHPWHWLPVLAAAVVAALAAAAAVVAVPAVAVVAAVAACRRRRRKPTVPQAFMSVVDGLRVAPAAREARAGVGRRVRPAVLADRAVKVEMAAVRSS